MVGRIVCADEEKAGNIPVEIKIAVEECVEGVAVAGRDCYVGVECSLK